jgi:hypothetical protein
LRARLPRHKAPARGLIEASRGQALLRMAQYVLVDDRDGRVIAELASLEQAARLLRRLEAMPQGAPPMRLVRLNRRRRELSEVSSIVAIRPLQWPENR